METSKTIRTEINYTIPEDFNHCLQYTTETIPKKICKKLMNLDCLSVYQTNNPHFDFLRSVNITSEFDHLKRIYKALSNNVLNVTLKRKKIGRYNANRGISLGCLSRRLRHTLCRDLYVDLDIVNCHPAILNEIVNKQYKSLLRYVSKRDDVFDETKEFYNDVFVKHNAVQIREMLKNVFIRIMYNGSISNWLRQNELDKKGTSPFLMEFKEELCEMMNSMIDSNKTLLQSVKPNTNPNVLGRKFSILMQELEARVCETCLNKLQDYGLDIDFVDCYDGFMIKKVFFDNLSSQNVDLCKLLEETVKTSFGWDLQWKIKEMDEGFDESILDDSEPVMKDVIQHVQILSDYDMNGYIFNDPISKPSKKLCSSVVQQIYDYQGSDGLVIFLNQYWARVKGSMVLFISKNNGSFTIHPNKRAFIDNFTDVKVLVESKNGSDIKSASEWWLRQDNMRSYAKRVFQPDINRVSDDEFNIFHGWNLDFSAKPCDQELIEIEKRINPFITHIKEVWADNVEEHYQYLLKWLAYPIQKYERTNVAVVLKGSQGTGKTILLNKMREIYGNYYSETSDKENVIGAYNEKLLSQCIFLVMSECFWAGDKSGMASKLKTLITDNVKTVTEKYRVLETLENFTNVMITSNKDWVIPAETTDRRFAVFECSDKYVGDFEYFKKIAAIDPLDIAFYLKYVVDLTDFNPCSLPKTEAYDEQKILSLDNVSKYYVGIIQESPEDLWDVFDDKTKSKEILKDDFYVAYQRNAVGFKVDVRCFWKTIKKLVSHISEIRPRNFGCRKRHIILPPYDECLEYLKKALKLENLDRADSYEDE